MKTLILLLAFVCANGTVFSQLKLRDGIYLVDQSVKTARTIEKRKKISLPLNPLFVEEDADEYPRVVLFTNDFVPLELADISVLHRACSSENELAIQLSGRASDKFKEFTVENRLSVIAIVVSQRVLKMYRIVRPVSDGRIVITGCSQRACDQTYSRLRRFASN